MYTLFALLFYLVACHALLDFPLQGDAVAVEKSRHSKSALQKLVPWYYWISAHALAHGFGVALITGSAWFGLAETIAHWFIDFFKCEGKYSIHVDQALHVLCKLVWVIIFLS